MLTYTYRAKSQNGTELRGVVQAVDRYDAAQKIRMNAPMIIELKQVKEKGDSIFNRDIGSNRINTKNLSVLCDQIAITLRSGIPLARCLQMIGSQCEDKILKKMMIATAEDVSAGSSVASSMERNCEQLPATLIETIRAGEQSGNIEHSFEVMSKYYEKTYKNQDKIKSAMSYPIFVICVAVVVLIVVMTMVVPALTQTFRDLGGELPLCTRILIGISDFFAKWWPIMVVIMVVMVIAMKYYFATPNGKITQGKMQLKMPGFGNINVLSGSAEFANTLSMLLKSGLTLNNAIPITAKTMSNYVLSQDVDMITPAIEEGRPLGECVNKCEYFPPILKEMCAIGEETGELDNTLDVIGDYYTNETDTATSKALAKLEPTMLVILALFAGFIVISVYLPMFTMYDLF